MKEVIIAIQARSTSKRLPGKVFLQIDGKEILQHVIDAAEESAAYVNNYAFKNKVKVKVVLLVPEGDEIVKRYKNKVIIFEGDEDDVLHRYVNMSREFNPAYIVRVTADCPLLPSYIITKHINIATSARYDYVSNVDENCRTCIDGHDVEVLSQRALEWLDEHAVSSEEREHVTLAIRRRPTAYNFRIGHVIGHIYQPYMKLSIDTMEDFERIKEEYFKIKQCIEKAIEQHGEKSVYRI